MRLGVILILLVLIAVCAAKSTKSKSQKEAKSKATKDTETTKHKDSKHDKKHKDSSAKKDSSKKHDAKKKKEKAKHDDKKTNQTTVESKVNGTKANLTKELPSNCQDIINEYSNGRILMYEYKIQMGRCMKKAKADAEKKMQVPVGYQTPFNTQAFNMPVQPQGMPGQQAAPFYPNAAQAPVNPAPVQNQVPDQTQAAFAPSPMNQYPANPAPFQPAQPNMGMNTVARTNIPENAQPQPPASQANAVFDQWRASSFGAKKDETPGAPNAPSNDQFADFMKMQSTSPEAAAPSQQAVMPAVVQQRSDIQQQPNMFDTQPQVPAPAQGQAFLTQPQAPFPGQGF